MITDDMIRELCTITTCDEAGRHFTETSQHWEALEAEGLIDVFRPTHDATGIQYEASSWHVSVTPEGQALVDASEHLHPSI